MRKYKDILGATDDDDEGDNVVQEKGEQDKKRKLREIDKL